MKKFLITLSVLLPIFVSGQQVPILKYDQLKKLYTQENDTLYLVNYWATWCKPCVEELPEFIKLNNELEGKKFSFIMVSLDFPQHIDKRVVPFIQKHQIKNRVVLLDDDANVWINKVNRDWDGSIPATEVIFNGHREFYNQTLSYNQLKQIVEPKIK